MSDWLQDRLPYDPLAQPHMRRLPGTVPLGDLPWLLRDEGFAGQMRLRDRLAAERPDEVMAALPGSGAAVAELLGLVVAALSDDPGYAVSSGSIRRPDGVAVGRDLPPLVQLARLVQEDLFVLDRSDGDEHLLIAGTLLFPAHWSLAEKIGRPLGDVHRIVAPYDEGIARRVQRMFDMIRPGQGLWRFNFHGQGGPDLFAPQTEADPKPRCPLPAPFLRSERQTFVRLPQTGAVVFGIHTYVVARANLSPDLGALLDEKVARQGR